MYSINNCALEILGENGTRYSIHRDVLKPINLVNHLGNINYTGLHASNQGTRCPLPTAKMAGAIHIDTPGHIENTINFSLLQLVIDNEISGYLYRSKQGVRGKIISWLRKEIC